MKNPWPIGISLFIGGLFAGAAFVAVTMIRQPVDLVVKDYYEQDLQHAQRMAEEERAKAMESPPVITRAAAERTVTIAFSTAATGTITLYRPSDSALDRQYEITLDSERRHMVDTTGMAAGLWRIQLAWVQNGDSYYHTESLVLP